MWKAIVVIAASLALILVWPIPAEGDDLEGQRYEGNVENYTLFVGKWDHLCTTYSTTDAGLAALVDQSLELWGSVSPITNCGNVAAGADITVRGVATGSLGINVLGQAGCAGSGGFIVGCNVSITAGARTLGVVAHEIGHALGLGHSQRGDQLMSAFCCSPLGFDDIAGIQFLYGAKPGATVTPTPTFVFPTATPIPPTATPRPQTIIYRSWLPGIARD